MMRTRIRLLNRLIGQFGYRSYLEIGCDRDATFRKVHAAHKVGVDPLRGGTLRMTSDEFFAGGNCGAFDLVFIDGLHDAGQVRLDVLNSLSVLNPGGCIVVHDCLPERDEHQIPIQEFRDRFGYDPPAGRSWCGDTWKTAAEMRAWAWPDLAVLDDDWGLGIVAPRPNGSPVTGRAAVRMLSGQLGFSGDWVWVRSRLRLLGSIDEAIGFVRSG